MNQEKAINIDYRVKGLKELVKLHFGHCAINKGEHDISIFYGRSQTPCKIKKSDLINMSDPEVIKRLLTFYVV